MDIWEEDCISAINNEETYEIEIEEDLKDEDEESLIEYLNNRD